MPSNEKIAIAAHLHVLLRRKTGRVTDTEWMATNQQYAFEIARFAREKAAEDGHVDLIVWAAKLEECMAAPDPRQRVPLVTMVTEAVRERSAVAARAGQLPDRQSAQSVDTAHGIHPESGTTESTLSHFLGDSESPGERKARDPNAPRYVKGLR